MSRTVTLKSRLKAMGAVTIFSVLLTTAVGLFGIQRSDQGLVDSIGSTDTVRHLMSVDMAHDAIHASVMRAFYGLSVGNRTEYNEATASLAEDVSTMEAQYAALVAAGLPAPIPDQLRATEPAMKEYTSIALSVVKLAGSDKVAAHARVPEFIKNFELLEVELEALGDQIQEVGSNQSLAAVEFNALLIKVLVVVSLAATLLTAYGSYSAFQSVVNPIVRLRQALREVATGDFGIRIGEITHDADISAIARDIDLVTERIFEALEQQKTMKSAGESVIKDLGGALKRLTDGNLDVAIDRTFPQQYEGLRHDFNEMVGQLNVLISQVIRSSSDIRGRATDMSSAAVQLSERTETQAATLEETAAALAQITTSVQTAAHNAKDVEEVILTARDEAHASGTIVENAILAMNEIESSSRQISQIIGVIEDIAFQTNLLALNAGVEAARAGDSGRGFAVVASEVRALAQRSSQAATEIKSLIIASERQVDQGVSQVGQAGVALAKTVEHVGRISSLVSEIASASSHQAQGLSEINAGMVQLDQVTQQNVSMAATSGQAMHAMLGDANGLFNIVERFQSSAGKPNSYRAKSGYRAA